MLLLIYFSLFLTSIQCLGFFSTPSNEVQSFHNGSVHFANGSLIYQQGLRHNTVDAWIILPGQEVLPNGCFIFRQEGRFYLEKSRLGYVLMVPNTVWCNGDFIYAPHAENREHCKECDWV